MENSINSPSSKSPVPGFKSLFKKPVNTSQVFDVSLSDSTAAVETNKSNIDLDVTPCTTNTKSLFRRKRKSIQPFNVGLDDSNAESEKSNTIPIAFAKKNRTFTDNFDVSFSETITSSQPGTHSKTIDESNIIYNKKNLFKKINKNQNEILLGDESSGHLSIRGISNKTNMEQPPEECFYNTDVDDTDPTTYLTKQNPFKNPYNEKYSVMQSSLRSINKGISMQNITNESQLFTFQNDHDNDNDDDSNLTAVKTKTNPFKAKLLKNKDFALTTNEDVDCESSKENAVTEPRQSVKDITLDQSLSSITNNTTYLEQSSINDENLNNWMSEQSDEEMPPLRVPSVLGSLSQTKVAPAKKPDENSSTVWEQKVNEIIFNAEKKSQTLKSKISSVVSQKPKQFKKPETNAAKPPEDLKIFKPPKLIKPASFITKKMYEHIIKKLKPKYGIDTMLESEHLVSTICETVKIVTRRKNYQKQLILNLKKDMAEAGVIETTMDFYEFIIKFLPHSFRVKVVPCLQPVTNVVYPPRDVSNPFDKIL